MLTDEQIDEIAVAELGLEVDQDEMNGFARAIEAAACAERDARIAELEDLSRQLCEQAEVAENAYRKIERQLEDARTEANALRVNEMNLEAALVSSGNERP